MHTTNFSWLDPSRDSGTQQGLSAVRMRAFNARAVYSVRDSTYDDGWRNKERLSRNDIIIACWRYGIIILLQEGVSTRSIQSMWIGIIVPTMRSHLLSWKMDKDTQRERLHWCGTDCGLIVLVYALFVLALQGMCESKRYSFRVCLWAPILPS